MFGPDSFATRDFVADTITRAYESEYGNISLAAVTLPRYEDIEQAENPDSIYKLSALGAVNGYPDNLVRPLQAITRAEISKIAALAFEDELMRINEQTYTVISSVITSLTGRTAQEQNDLLRSIIASLQAADDAVYVAAGIDRALIIELLSRGITD